MSELTAGRELDALIAQKVLGWTRKTALDGWDDMWPPGHDGDITKRTTAPGFQRIPHYSTDIAAAFQLLEKTAHWDLDFDEDRSLEYVCEVGFHIDKVEGRGGGMCKMRGAWAETAPLAICRAVLKVFTEEAACES